MVSILCVSEFITRLPNIAVIVLVHAKFDDLDQIDVRWSILQGVTMFFDAKHPSGGLLFCHWCTQPNCKGKV